MMGYAQDEAEEVIGRVLSVIDSTDHFLEQTVGVLNEVYAHNAQCYPLLCMMAVCDQNTCTCSSVVLVT